MTITLFSSFLIVALFFSCITSTTHDFDGVFYGIWDIHIACAEQPVPNHSNGLPIAYSETLYSDSMQLCSAMNSEASRTVGCVCSSDQVNGLHCHPDIADPRLYNAVWTTTFPVVHTKTFPQYCQEQCICRPAMESMTGGKDDPTTNESFGQSPFESSSQADSFASTGNNAKTVQGKTSAGEQGATGFEHGPWTQIQNSSNVSHDQCGRNCTTNSECKAGCMCSVQSEQYQPGKGTVAFLAACIISMASQKTLNPRAVDDGNPCACNSTYVSFACCDAPDGLVREDGAFKLGELIVES